MLSNVTKSAWKFLIHFVASRNPEFHGGHMFTTGRLSTEEARRLLEMRRLPGRLNAAVSAVLLGFESQDIPILVGRGMLKPLGKPAPNSTKYFSAESILRLMRDEAWLDRATVAVGKHWREKNLRKSTKAQTAT